MRRSRRRAPIDLVVNNAGFGTNGTFHELDTDRLADEIELNVRGADPPVARRPGGDGAAPVAAGCSTWPAWPASSRRRSWPCTPPPRRTSLSLTESLHEEVKASGVHVTALCPGLTKTEFQRVSNTAALRRPFPASAWTSPELVARTGLDDVVANKAIAVPGAPVQGC